MVMERHPGRLPDRPVTCAHCEACDASIDVDDIGPCPYCGWTTNTETEENTP